MEHLFDVEVAKQYGVNAAIMIRHFQFWIIKNKANGKHLHDGRTWTYNTVQALAKIFDYWTPKQVRRILEGLLRKKVLIKSNYNQNGYDRTSWYAFEDEERFAKTDKLICPKGQMEQAKRAGRFDRKGGPIPVTIPNPSTDELTKSKELKVSSEGILELDLEIAKGKKHFLENLPKIFHHINEKEAKTFSRMLLYIVEECQAGRIKPSIFYEAIDWAKEAMRSNATNKKGLFTSKVKQATGFKAQKKLLKD